MEACRQRECAWYPSAKRLFDLLISFGGLLVFSPLIAIVALLIKMDSPGPVFYRGERVGRFGKAFRIYKFRTMVAGADKTGASSTPEDDPRITKMGRVLRRYKLDELPQLINVLKGEMSFVGPRPQVQWAVDLYTPEERQVLTICPGITDHASLHFHNEGEILRGSADPDRDYMEKIHPEKMRLSLEYVRMCSLWIDIKIIAQTILTVFGPRSK